MKARLLIACFTITTIYGCAAPGVKPKDSNIFQAAGNIATGEFDKQLEREHLKLQEVEQQLEQEQTKSSTLGTTLGDKQAEKEQLEQNLLALRQKNTALESEIRSANVDTAAKVQARNAHLVRLAELRKEIDVLAVEASKAAADAGLYRARIDKLNEEIEVLRGIALSQ